MDVLDEVAGAAGVGDAVVENAIEVRVWVVHPAAVQTGRSRETVVSVGSSECRLTKRGFVCKASRVSLCFDSDSISERQTQTGKLSNGSCGWTDLNPIH